jgi:glutamate mutase epsilon subunit
MTQNRLKKYGKMQFTCSKKEQVQEVNLKEDCKFQAQLKEAKAYFSEIDEEASNAKRLQELKNEVDVIIDELIPTLKKLSDLRKKMNQ